MFWRRVDIEAAVDKLCKLLEIMVCVKHAAVPHRVQNITSVLARTQKFYLLRSLIKTTTT